ncbi:MAG: RNA polymerase sigma factor [Chloroflexota bacterium]
MGEKEVESLAAKAAAGDDEAFGQLYERYLDNIYRYVYYRVGSSAEAEDLTQRIFFKTWEAMGRFHPNGTPFVAWLMRIAHNALVDHWRTRKETHRLDDGVPCQSVWSDPVAALNLSCTHGQLRQAILALKPDQQRVILLRFIDGLDYATVAATLGKSEGAVRVLQCRALAALRECLRQEGKES